MSKFEIDCTKCSFQVQELEIIEVLIRKLENNLKEIRTGVGSLDGCNELVPVLHKIEEDIHCQADSTRNMKEGLERIIQYYKKADKNSQIPIEVSPELHLVCASNNNIYLNDNGDEEKTAIGNIFSYFIGKSIGAAVGAVIGTIISGRGEDIKKSENGEEKNEYRESTKELVKQEEGAPFLEPRINDDGTITIGYGYDFTEEEDPDMFNKYLCRDEEGNIKVKQQMTEKEAEETIKLAAEKKGITQGLEQFISGEGNGNKGKPLNLNQEQYDALFSYFYSNGPMVFTDDKYNEWKGYGGEYAERAEARKELRDYLINNNGNYDPQSIEDLFVGSKGANIKYDYAGRRREEANYFNGK